MTHGGTIRGLVTLLGPLQGPVRTHPVQPGGIVVLTRRDCRARQRSNDDATVRDDAAIAPLDDRAQAAARERLDRLTSRPAASGGWRISSLSPGITGSAIPPWTSGRSSMAADHGIVAQGISAFPSVVTGQMVANFLAGGAAISVLGRLHRARLVVVDLGVVVPPAPHDRLVSRRSGRARGTSPGTGDDPDGGARRHRGGDQLASGLAADGCRLVIRARWGSAIRRQRQQSSRHSPAGRLSTSRAGHRPRRRRPGPEGRGHRCGDRLHRPDPSRPGRRARRGRRVRDRRTGGAHARRGRCAHPGRPRWLHRRLGGAGRGPAGARPRSSPHRRPRSAEPGHTVVLEALGLRPLPSSTSASARRWRRPRPRRDRCGGPAPAEMATFEEAAVSDRSARPTRPELRRTGTLR